MTQTLQSIQARAAELRDLTKVRAYKTEVVRLNGLLSDFAARANLAERQAREATAQREQWKRRALEAEARLKSLGDLA